MQPVDPQDKRKPYTQIASSIRAAILSGELEPGSRLDSGEELARFFGVSRMTVTAAVRILREEGFVRSRAGAGVYVRDEAQLPVPDEGALPLIGAAAFLFEMGHLKRVPRAGWLMLTGTGRPESVAEHSFRVGVTAIVLAAMAGADAGRTAMLALFHDAHETRTGDIPAVGRAYLTAAAPQAVTAHQVSAMPDELAKVFQALTDEYEAGETPEARLARDADKLETLLQAIEYKAEGLDTADWRRTSLEALRTGEAKQLARAIGAGRPSDWYAAFNASYHELRAGARQRGRALDQ
jgi:5'-deoxynucleotidase YfbR-like HD superfamily hydrolase/DNA-binding transcriptional regulator YhcF (GntR family)